jgi:WD40 repeat protein
VYRLETDANTQTTVSPSGVGISNFALSNDNLRLALITQDNRLLVTDGTNSSEVFNGGAVAIDEDGFPTVKSLVENAITSVSFSPDNSKLLYGYRGVNIYDFVTNTNINIVPNRPAEDPNDEFMIGATIAGESIWSPDGTKAVVFWQYALEGSYLMLLDMINNTVMLPEIISSDGLPLCCADVAWSNDSTKLYFASASAIYPGEAGAWILEVASNSMTALTPTFSNAVALADGMAFTANDIVEFRGIKDTGDGNLLFLMGVSQISNGTLVSRWNVYRAQGALAQRINTTSFNTLSNVFWSPNAMGFIAQFDQTYAYFDMNNVRVDLPMLQGYDLKATWGK